VSGETHKIDGGICLPTIIMWLLVTAAAVHDVIARFA
jgi:hypothetical protein